MAKVIIQRYEDGNINILRSGRSITIDQIRLVGTLDEVIDVLRWEFIGYGQSVPDDELERIAWRVMGELR